MRFIGIKAESVMRAGSLVPDTVMLRLILNELKTRGWLLGLPQTMSLSSSAAVAPSLDDAADPYMTSFDPTLSPQTSDDPSASFILDGFPRTATQAQQIDKTIDINWVVHLQTPTSVILDRIANRLVHEPSGRVYNTTFNPPKVAGQDDITGEKLTRRADDNPETWKARLKKFEETSQSLLEHYDGKGVLWGVQGNSSDEITPKLFREFERRFM